MKPFFSDVHLSIIFRPFPAIQYIIAAFGFASANHTCHYITNLAFSQLPIVRCLIQAFLHSDVLCRKELRPDVYFSSFFSVSLWPHHDSSSRLTDQNVWWISHASSGFHASLIVCLFRWKMIRRPDTVTAAGQPALSGTGWYYYTTIPSKFQPRHLLDIFSYLWYLFYCLNIC